VPDAEIERTIDDSRIIFALLHALRIPLDAPDNDLDRLIAAAAEGAMQSLESYCARIHDDPKWIGIVQATITAIAALRRTFYPLRDQLQPLLDASLAEHQKAARQSFEDYIRNHGRA
jgi:hypothetical protein